MVFAYTLAIRCVDVFLRFVAFFNRKISLFVAGRQNWYATLEKQIDKTESYVWVHTASLGEFEQGLPVIKKLKKENRKILVTFFSPSGYEVKKNSPDADIITYLPLDTPENARKFIGLVRPEMAIFVKYEFWYHFLMTLKKGNIPTYLLSGIFRENQIFFRWYGGFMQRCLHSFTHFFVQNEPSKLLLQSLHFNNVTVSGDTRFDRVGEILQRDNELSFMQTFKNSQPCMVFGSSWEEDEAIYIPFINTYQGPWKFVIAPHNIKANHMASLQTKISKTTVLYSEINMDSLPDIEVLIVDTIGILTKVYSYANLAYVGGGMGNTGLHNVLEPAVFGIPVLIGKNYNKFEEAKNMINLGGILPVESEKQFAEKTSFLMENASERERIGEINSNFIEKSSGATTAFIHFVENSSSYNDL